MKLLVRVLFILSVALFFCGYTGVEARLGSNLQDTEASSIGRDTQAPIEESTETHVTVEDPTETIAHPEESSLTEADQIASSSSIDIDHSWTGIFDEEVSVKDAPESETTRHFQIGPFIAGAFAICCVGGVIAFTRSKNRQQD